VWRLWLICAVALAAAVQLALAGFVAAQRPSIAVRRLPSVEILPAKWRAGPLSAAVQAPCPLRAA
jgi:hypothetical protein